MWIEADGAYSWIVPSGKHLSKTAKSALQRLGRGELGATMDSLTDLEERLHEEMHADRVVKSLLVDNERFADKPLPSSLWPADSIFLDHERIAENVQKLLGNVPDRWKIEYLEYVVDVVADKFYEPWWRRLGGRIVTIGSAWNV